jgi:hypothetical protein
MVCPPMVSELLFLSPPFVTDLPRSVAKTGQGLFEGLQWLSVNLRRQTRVKKIGEE